MQRRFPAGARYGQRAEVAAVAVERGDVLLHLNVVDAVVGVDTEAKTGHQLDRQVESGRRFISQDPAGFAGGSTNLYQYATGDPVNLSDPNGDCPICIAMVAQCAIGGLISLAIGWGSAQGYCVVG